LLDAGTETDCPLGPAVAKLGFESTQQRSIVLPIFE
jgi:hypothetical protein